MQYPVFLDREGPQPVEPTSVCVRVGAHQDVGARGNAHLLVICQHVFEDLYQLQHIRKPKINATLDSVFSLISTLLTGARGREEAGGEQWSNSQARALNQPGAAPL